jgi:predicted nucleic-acid-binding protein
VIALDTNVLVRYLMQDDAVQSPLANRLIDALSADEPGFVPLVVVVELVLVLSSAYGLGRDQVAGALEGLLHTRELVVESAEIVAQALRIFSPSNADFADCLIERSAAAAGCVKTMTFDRGAAKGCGMVLVS